MMFLEILGVVTVVAAALLAFGWGGRLYTTIPDSELDNREVEGKANCKAESGTQEMVRPVLPSENLQRCG